MKEYSKLIHEGRDIQFLIETRTNLLEEATFKNKQKYKTTFLITKLLATKKNLLQILYFLRFKWLML